MAVGTGTGKQNRTLADECFDDSRSPKAYELLGDISIMPVLASWHEPRDCFRVRRGAGGAIAMPRTGSPAGHRCPDDRIRGIGVAERRPSGRLLCSHCDRAVRSAPRAKAIAGRPVVPMPERRRCIWVLSAIWSGLLSRSVLASSRPPCTAASVAVVSEARSTVGSSCPFSTSRSSAAVIASRQAANTPTRGARGRSRRCRRGPRRAGPAGSRRGTSVPPWSRRSRRPRLADWPSPAPRLAGRRGVRPRARTGGR